MDATDALTRKVCEGTQVLYENTYCCGPNHPLVRVNGAAQCCIDNDGNGCGNTPAPTTTAPATPTVVKKACYCNTCSNGTYTTTGGGSWSESDCMSQECHGELSWGTSWADRSCAATTTKAPTGGSNPTTAKPTGGSNPTTAKPTTAKPTNTVAPTDPENPQTGASTMIIVWMIALATIGYSVWYFKRSSTN